MMKLKFASRNFMVQVLGLLLLWCLAIYTIYQIRSMSFETLHIPTGPRVDLRLIIYQPNEPPKLDFSPYKNLDGLPMDYWNANQEHLKSRNSCANFPNPSAIEFHQTYWQSLHASNTTIRILNAYLDTRKENIDKATVRILAMIERSSDNSELSVYCQLWFDKQPEPVTVKSHKNTPLWRSDDSEALPYLINCAVPSDYYNLIPVAVSLVEKPCDNAENVLKINYYNRYEKKKDFGVCVKGFDNPQNDMSDKLIEWVELVKILGGENVFFYDLHLHPNVKNILNYYEKERVAHVTDLELAEGPYELTKMQREIVPYTDCFLKHMYEFKYIVILDIDEIVLPLKTNSWKTLIDLENRNVTEVPAFYNVKNLYFVDTSSDEKNIPGYTKMLQNVYKTKNDHESFVQIFFNTEKMLTLHNDLTVNCLSDCVARKIKADEAQLQHYHKDCALENTKSCVDFTNGTVVDRHIWNFKEVLLEKVVATRKHLSLSVD